MNEESKIVDDSTAYPCFLYRGGDASNEVMVCGSKEIEDDWHKRGFVRAGHDLTDAYKLPVPSAPQEFKVSAMEDPTPKEMPQLPTEQAQPAKLEVDPDTHAVITPNEEPQPVPADEPIDWAHSHNEP